jgi:hypothetical protein
MRRLDRACLARALGLAALLDLSARPADAVPETICTDRPTRANAPCTVPAGRWQVETDVVNWTRSEVRGVRTDVLLVADPTVKYGLGARTDLELNLLPYVALRTRDTRPGEGVTRADGIGDLFLRLKWNLLDASGPVGLTLLPFVKAPTAKHGVGDDAWEGGLIVPISVDLPNRFQLAFAPEFDALADADGDGRHLAVANVLTLSRPVSDSVTLDAELFAAQNLDPAGQTNLYSADVAASCVVHDTFQLDLGANFGLNSATPALQVYVGVAKLF